MDSDSNYSPECFGLYEARNKLSELIDRVVTGEEVIITRHGKPVARLVAERVPDVDASAVDRIFSELSKLASGFEPDVTLEELRGFIDEDRK